MLQDLDILFCFQLGFYSLKVEGKAALANHEGVKKHRAILKVIIAEEEYEAKEIFYPWSTGFKLKTCS